SKSSPHPTRKPAWMRGVPSLLAESSSKKRACPPRRPRVFGLLITSLPEFSRSTTGRASHLKGIASGTTAADRASGIHVAGAKEKESHHEVRRSCPRGSRSSSRGGSPELRGLRRQPRRRSGGGRHACADRPAMPLLQLQQPRRIREVRVRRGEPGGQRRHALRGMRRGGRELRG